MKKKHMKIDLWYKYQSNIVPGKEAKENNRFQRGFWPLVTTPTFHHAPPHDLQNRSKTPNTIQGFFHGNQAPVFKQESHAYNLEKLLRRNLTKGQRQAVSEQNLRFLQNEVDRWVKKNINTKVGKISIAKLLESIEQIIEFQPMAPVTDKQELALINYHVITEVVPKILSHMQEQTVYLQTISNVPKPLIRPSNERSLRHREVMLRPPV